MFETAEVIAVGTWLYAGAVTTEVRIMRWHTIYGTGDHKDSEETQQDRDVECYYIQFES